MSRARWILIGAVGAVTLGILLMNRYEMTPSTRPPGAWRHDRLTGEITFCRLGRSAIGNPYNLDCVAAPEPGPDFSSQAR